MSTKAGFLGLGAMGSRMAANLLKAGHNGHRVDRSPRQRRRSSASGARRASSRRRTHEEFPCAMTRAWLVGRRIRTVEQCGDKALVRTSVARSPESPSEF